MPTQYRFPLHPAGAKEVNEVLAIHEAKGQVAYFAAGVPVFTHAADDPVGRRFAAVQLVELGLAGPTEVAPPAASPRPPRASPPPRPSRGPGSSAPCRPCSSTGSSRWASTSTAACATA